MVGDSEEQPKKSGWGDLGPKWITAIATLLTALTGAGFFVGRSSAPDTKPMSPSTVTASAAIVTVTTAQQAATTASSGTPANTDSGVYSAEDIDWGSYNLDFKTPTYLSNKYITSDDNNLVSYGNAAKLAEWQTDSLPGKEDCSSAVAERGTDYTGTLVKGNHVCGKTTEGRVFRIDVVGANGKISSKVVVWNK